VCQPTFLTGKTRAGDVCILATDALAKWIIQHEESGKLGTVLKHFINIELPDQDFNNFVKKEREAKTIHLVDDDVTLMVISIEPDQQLPKIDPIEQGVKHQNDWFILLVCLLAGGGTLIALYLVFSLLLKFN